MSTKTHASGMVTLTPVRFSEMAKPAQGAPGAPEKPRGYIAPNKRSSDTSAVTTLDFTSSQFPSMRTLELAPTEKKTGYMTTILNLIAKDQMDEIERNREPEVDPLKMSPIELASTGWAVLPIVKNTKQIVMHYNDSENLNPL